MGTAVPSGAREGPRSKPSIHDRPLTPNQRAETFTAYHSSPKLNFHGQAKRQVGERGSAPKNSVQEEHSLPSLARIFPATKGLHPPLLLRLPLSGRQSSPARAPLPREVRPWPLSLLRNGDEGSGSEQPPPQPRGGAATTAARGPGWGPMEPELQRNSPRRLLRPGPELERKGYGRRGVSSGLPCPAPCQDPRAA